MSMDIMIPTIDLLFSLFIAYKWKFKSLKDDIFLKYNKKGK